VPRDEGAVDKAVAEQAAAEEVPRDEGAVDKAVAEQAAAEEVAADEGAVDKAVAEQAAVAADKALVFAEDAELWKEVNQTASYKNLTEPEGHTARLGEEEEEGVDSG
jgi:Tfp pilus assembly protein PilX